MQLGSDYLGEGRCVFTVWAPLSEKVILHIVQPAERFLEMKKTKSGYFTLETTNTFPGTRYLYKFNDIEEFPDPASHFQPTDVHSFSEVVDHKAFQWQDNNWKGIALKDAIIYELHIGTFTSAGTFESTISKLDELVDLGINAIELMPISQFSGNRNWGYDGAYIYSVHNTYGTPDQFKKLVEECHLRGIAVILDVVYNHVGPEGNYLPNYGPYFTTKYCTPWGDSLNFDGEYSDGVRDYYSDNALFWLEQYHIDGLRLDATHMVFDMGAIHFWEYTSEKVKAFSQKSWPRILIAESDLNGLRPIKPKEAGGYGLDAQWLDDFHHALYVLLDSQGKQYYADFGEVRQMAKALKDGFVHSGEYVEFRKRKHGTTSAGVPGDKFIVFSQNHDQIGNRMLGERNSVLMSFEALKLAAAAVLLSPYVPMLFMGEEHGEENPFLYFVSHLDNQLAEAVREGRKKDFGKFNFQGEPPDPQSEETFNKSKLQWDKRRKGKHAILLSWHKELIRLRKTIPALSNYDKESVEVNVLQDKVLLMKRSYNQNHILIVFNFTESDQYIEIEDIQSWKIILDSSDGKWQEEARLILGHNEYHIPSKFLKLQSRHVLLYEKTNS